MVPTDTRGCGSYMGHRSVALTWSSVVDDRPDRPSRAGRRHRRNVWCECSSKSIHCSKVHGSYHPRTIGLGSFTRRPVWTRRASHPAPSGRPPRGGAKVTWFRYSCEYRRLIKCLGVFQNTPRTYVNVLNHVTLRRAPRGRPDLAGCLPRCVRTDGRVEVCAKSVPTLVEPRTFEQCVLKEEHSNQTSGHGAGI